MVLSREERVELLERARAVKASKKKEREIKFLYFVLVRKVIESDLAFCIEARLVTTASPLPTTLEFEYSASSASLKFFSLDTTLIEY